MKLSNSFASFVMCCFPFTTYAIPQWEMIPNESTLSFTATQNGSPITGEFKQFTAKLLVDVTKLQESSIDILIDMNSLTTSYAEIKNTLQTSDWFNVSLFPKAEFKSTEFIKTGESTYQSKGTLTIRDKSIPITLTFTSSFPTQTKGIVTGSTTLKRSAFGVGQGEWSSTEQIKDDVLVNFKVTAIKKN